MNYAALKTELQTDPQALGYAGKTPDQQAALLNAVNRNGRKPIDPAKLKDAAFESGGWRKLLEASETHATATVKYTAKAFVSYVDDRRMTSLNLDKAAVVAMIDALRNASPAVLTAGERTGLLAMGDTLVSRAFQVLGMDIVLTADDIKEALLA